MTQQKKSLRQLFFVGGSAMPRQSAPTDLAGAAVATYATKIWGVALASSAAAISGTINSGGGKTAAPEDTFFDLAVVAQQTTCVSAMPRDHFGCALWRENKCNQKIDKSKLCFYQKTMHDELLLLCDFHCGFGFYTEN